MSYSCSWTSWTPVSGRQHNILESCLLPQHLLSVPQLTSLLSLLLCLTTFARLIATHLTAAALTCPVISPQQNPKSHTCCRVEWPQRTPTLCAFSLSLWSSYYFLPVPRGVTTSLTPIYDSHTYEPEVIQLLLLFPNAVHKELQLNVTPAYGPQGHWKFPWPPIIRQEEHTTALTTISTALDKGKFTKERKKYIPYLIPP